MSTSGDAAVAQLGERPAEDRVVGGSSPPGGTTPAPLLAGAHGSLALAELSSIEREQRGSPRFRAPPRYAQIGKVGTNSVGTERVDCRGSAVAGRCSEDEDLEKRGV